jgi:hypothetical protein
LCENDVNYESNLTRFDGDTSGGVLLL